MTTLSADCGSSLTSQKDREQGNKSKGQGFNIYHGGGGYKSVGGGGNIMTSDWGVTHRGKQMFYQA